MAYDLLIKNGTVVDGTGAPGYRADVAVADGRIVEIGKIADGAARTIDASDLVVAPGFIDPHTHYDAQICWDPMVTCSSWHGVTTVVMGNCGVGLAPCKPAERDIATWNLVHVEAIPYDVMNRGLTWDWETFPDYMDAAERRGLGINIGCLAALSPFRQWVMGEESMERAATEEETSRIRNLLREAMAAGAMGFSLTVMPQHLGYKAQPLACRLASDDAPQAWTETLEKAEPLLRRGCRPQVAARPLIIEFNLVNPFIFANMDVMKPVFGEKTIEQQKKVYADPEFRRVFGPDLERRSALYNFWGRARIKETTNPALKTLEWKSVEEIAAMRGKSPVDTFFDLAIEDELKLVYMMPLLDINEERVAKKFSDPRTMIGISDGGAHVDMLCNAGYPTYLLGTFVRERQALGLEHAIRRITSEPAAFFGMSDRGRLAAGMAADITIFDFDTIGSPERPEARNDLPGGARRLVTTAEGIKYTIVNGQVIFEGIRHTGALPGRVLRSGQPTA